jgi:hypothetical protein
MGIIRGKVQHNEWTRFENGKPVCGVGYRGFWTNKVTIGGESPFRECTCGANDCQGWVSKKDPTKHAVVMTFKEFLDYKGEE